MTGLSACAYICELAMFLQCWAALSKKHLLMVLVLTGLTVSGMVLFKWYSNTSINGSFYKIQPDSRYPGVGSTHTEIQPDSRYPGVASTHTEIQPDSRYPGVGSIHTEIQPDSRYPGVGSTHTESNHEITSLLEEEVRTVTSRIRHCLAVINMTDYFIANRYIATAERDARDILKWLRQTIPRFKSKYSLPCWNASFNVVRVPSSETTMKGTLNGKTFSYDETGFVNTVRNTVWTGKPPQVSCSTVCLPKIFILGYLKCGTTYLFCLLNKILVMKLGVKGQCMSYKEPHFWAGKSNVLPKTLGYLSLYLLNHERAAEFVEKNMPAITIDATPNLMYRSPRYSKKETWENYCLLPSLIPVILPDSKYFVVMRNPVTMLYSGFWFSCTSRNQKSIYPIKYRGPDIFHKRITEKITMFNNCKDRGQPLDKCVNIVSKTTLFSSELPTCGRTNLDLSLYYFHTRKWLSVIPRERIHFFTLEELATQDSKLSTAEIILNHLELDVTDQEMQTYKNITCTKYSQELIDYKHDPRLQMREDTRQILEEFFQPYNQMLAELLRDDKFLWK